MGNNHSGQKPNSGNAGGGGGTSLSRRASTASGRNHSTAGQNGGAGNTGSMSRSASGTDITEKNHTKFVQVEKLAKILQQKSHVEHGVNGICADTFVRHVFADHPPLGYRLFAHLHHASKAQTRHIGTVAFRQQCERYLACMDDTLILETFVRMYADGVAGSHGDTADTGVQHLGQSDTLTARCMQELLAACFELAMAHYLDDGRSATCPLLERTLAAATAGVFFSAADRPAGSEQALSVGFVCRWLTENCAQLVPPVHRYCVHRLTTAYRELGAQKAKETALLDVDVGQTTTTVDAAGDPVGNGGGASEAVPSHAQHPKSLPLSGPVAALQRREPTDRHSVELATPVLDNANPFDALHPPLLPLSMAWLLACALPPLYAKPQPAALPGSVAAAAGGATVGQQQAQQLQPPSPAAAAAANQQPQSQLASAAFMARLLSAVPSHWTLLYDSRQDGVGANRFLHHVLGYRGPTLSLLKAANGQVWCVASAAEWRESTMYQGAAECAVLQVQPRFALIEHGAKLLYLNTTQRGYPKGLRVGSDPRKPLVAIDEHFEQLDCRGISSPLQSIEVWGCGDQRSRDVQLDIRKWQIREAERQRTVKLTAADWLDHPDRYLLELGGRAQYNNSSK